jgi:hypothetical protein
MVIKAETTPAPVQRNPDGSVKVPTSTPTASPSSVTALDGSTVRAVAGSANTAEQDALAFGLDGVPAQATADAKDPLVTIKRATSYNNVAGSANSADYNIANNREVAVPQSEAKRRIFGDDSYRRRVADQMIAAGILSPNDANNLSAISKAWDKVVEQSAQFRLAGNDRTPEDVIRLINIQKKAAAPVRQYPYTTTTDESQVQTWTDAPSQVKDVLQRMLGRDPSSEELASYQAGLNSAAQANPQQSHSVQTEDANGNVVRQVSNSGGIDPTQVLGDMAQGDPEYGAYQASTTYMNALKSAIGAFVGG